MQSFLQPAWKFIIFKHLFFGQVSHTSEDLRDAYNSPIFLFIVLFKVIYLIFSYNITNIAYVQNVPINQTYFHALPLF